MPATDSANQNIPFDLSKFLKRSFLLIGSSILRLATQLIIIFLFSRKLTVTDYGLYQSAWLYINLISIAGLFGLPSLILSSSVNSIRSWIVAHKTKFLLLSALLNLLPVIYVLFGPNEYSVVIKLLLIALSLVQNFSILAETLAIKNRQEKLVLLANSIFAASYLVCHLGILYSGYSLTVLLVSITFLFMAKTAILILPGFRTITRAAAGAIKPVGKQWLYLGLNDVAGLLFKWLDKWLILSFISVAQFAIYFNGSYEIPVFGLMLSAVSNIMLVDLSGSDIKDSSRIKALFENSSLLLASVVFPSFCFLFFYSHPFFIFIFSEKYMEAIPVFVISIFVLPLRITNFTAVLQVNNRTDLILKGALLDLLLAVVFMALLYPLLQLKGLALAFVLSTYVQAAYYLWHTGKLINKRISYFFPAAKLIVLMMISIVVTGLFYWWFSNFEDAASLIPGILICIMLIAGLMLFHYKGGKKNLVQFPG
jgi:O-antigen/teichoic acid export membrane protein